jgi:histidinol-phosphate phosphatase family protein
VTRRRLLLLDRDGTLMEDVGYPNDPDRVRLIPGAAEAVRELAAVGFVAAVVSNQSGLARGLITPEQAAAVHERFVALFAEHSGDRLPCFYCPHGPAAGCGCRKPEPGLLHRAAAELGLVGAPAVVVGDKGSDVAAGRAFGAATVRLTRGLPIPAGDVAADHVATDWDDACRWLRAWADPGEGRHVRG